MASLLHLGVAALRASLGPCDIFAADGYPCVAAHSMVRALLGAYDGALYSVNRTSDLTVQDIGVVAAGGRANAAAQDKFCAGTDCFVQRIYDQSGRDNHLDIGPPGGFVKHGDQPVNATAHPVVVSGGHTVYAALFEGGMGYRNDKTSGVAVGNDPETLYMVTSGKIYNGGCCFDYGNAEVDNSDDGLATMEAIYFGNSTTTGRGAGAGPWVMADLEKGLWAGNERVNPDYQPLIGIEFVSAMVKGKTDGFALKAGDATQAQLPTLFDGPRPTGYQPMRKQGAIVLGIGGDNSDSAIGVFYEGAITAGISSEGADAALQANIAAFGYGK